MRITDADNKASATMACKVPHHRHSIWIFLRGAMDGRSWVAALLRMRHRDRQLWADLPPSSPFMTKCYFCHELAHLYLARANNTPNILQLGTIICS